MQKHFSFCRTLPQFGFAETFFILPYYYLDSLKHFSFCIPPFEFAKNIFHSAIPPFGFTEYFFILPYRHLVSQILFFLFCHSAYFILSFCKSANISHLHSVILSICYSVNSTLMLLATHFQSGILLTSHFYSAILLT